jgi:hypothetical protein
MGMSLSLGLTLGSRGSGGGVAPIVTYLPTVASSPVYARADRKLIAAYAGPALRNATGPVDMSFADVLASNTVIPVDIAYDQSGNGNNATQTTAINQPSLAPTGKINGVPPLAMLATTAQKYLNIPTTVAVNRQNCTIFTVLVPMICQTQTSYWGLDTVPSLGSNTDPNVLRVFPSGNYVTPLQLNTNPQILAYASGSGDCKIWAKGSFTSVGAQTALAMTGGQDGWLLNKNNPSSFQSAMIVYPTVLSQTDTQSVINALTTIYAIETIFTKKVIFSGDSLFFGFTSVFDGIWSNFINAISWPAGTQKFNYAIVGEAASQVATNRFDSEIVSTFGGVITYIEEHGTNDIALSGNTDTQLATYMDGLLNGVRTIATAQSKSVKAFICTMPPRDGSSNWDATKEGYRVAANTRRRALTGSSGQTWDFCFDMDKVITDAGITSSNTSYYYSDHLHFTPLMYNMILGPAMRAALIAAGSI